ncbi:MAG: hypothetical protein BWY76_03086 [bacterium ADurb.Bin429]|nr:MAG: hypothetical protein BWY76_03086 [bacterium ADurb.Bin429]
MRLDCFAPAAQDFNGIVVYRFFHPHDFKAALERGILFNITAILPRCGGADALNVTAREHRFQDIGGIHVAIARGARPHQRMELINKEDNVRVGGHLGDDPLETLLEFATILRAHHQAGGGDFDDALVLEWFVSDIIARQTLRETFDDAGLPYPGITNEDGIAHKALQQHLPEAEDLRLPANGRGELTVASKRGDIAPEAIQQRGFAVAACFPAQRFMGAAGRHIHRDVSRCCGASCHLGGFQQLRMRGAQFAHHRVPRLFSVFTERPEEVHRAQDFSIRADGNRFTPGEESLRFLIAVHHAIRRHHAFFAHHLAQAATGGLHVHAGFQEDAAQLF